MDNFSDFQKRLASLDLSDDGFVDELYEQNLTAYVNGLTARLNQDGEMGA